MQEPLSDQILLENRTVLEAMVNHRFIQDIKADRLDRGVFDRYLVYEGAFVDTAVAIFAFATAKAVTMAHKRRLIAILDALANHQIAFFGRAFAERGIDPNAHDTGLPEVAAFRDGMLAIAREGDFLDIVAAMFAAEWMYWTWSKAAVECTITDPLLKEWVEMHVEPAFEAQARWLKDILDTAGKTLGHEERARLSTIFAHVQALEIAFHDAPYLEAAVK
ncbi:TenA family protein [Roseibium marinum]|uniref:Aminopyrimidine aminohydrolase n=1 Tax=Roseibium marinum TaxID=281252 RepID=A0A2S3UL20_9HYPH|nr:TenA family protein [Roseibium marinum]POF28260.1 thiaminase/transcriptional activator TenA [Roseibium marinum]